MILATLVVGTAAIVLYAIYSSPKEPAMHAILIPADDDQPLKVVDVGTNVGTIGRTIKAEFVERVRCSLTDDQEDVSLTLAVDEDGLARGLRQNSRANVLYLGELGAQFANPGIVGDALALREGMTPGGPDWIDLGDPDAALAMVNERIESM